MLDPKKFGSEKKIEKIWVPKKSKKNLSTKNLSFWKKYWVWKSVGSTKIFGQKEFTPKKYYWSKMLGPEKFWIEKIFWARKRFLGWKILVHRNQSPKKLGPKSLVKIRPVTAKILLIWTNVARAYVSRTNVARTYVAWTNVSKTVGICSRWSQEPTFKVWSKSGQ